MSQQVMSVVMPLDNVLGGTDKTLFTMKAPSDALGGGITVVSAQAISDATLAAGTVNYFALALHKYSNAATPVLNGTVAAAVGGTAGWTAGVPKPFTISDTYKFLDAGEYLAVEYTEAGTGNPTDGAVLIQYVMGR